MILKLFVAIVGITVYPQCNSNILKVITTDMLQSFIMFIVILIKILLFKMFFKSLQL
jgi:hypothetical protein